MKATINLQDIVKNATKHTRQDGCPRQEPQDNKKIDIYLAGPYTHQFSFIRRRRFKQLTAMAGKIMKMGLVVFSPITHSHLIAKMGNMPTEWNFWKEQDWSYIDHTKVLAIYKLPGYKTSKGVLEEFTYSVFRKRIPFIIFETIEEFEMQAMLIPELRKKLIKK